jgi:hypothetical protein
MKTPDLGLARRAVAVLALATAVGASPVRAQTTLDFDDLVCNGNQLLSYGGWIALASGATCTSGTWGSSSTNFVLQSYGNLSWSWLGGPVVFNSLWVNGWGLFYLDLFSGGTLVHSQLFYLFGSPASIASSYSGLVDAAQVRLYWGYVPQFGVDNISFNSTWNPGGPGGDEDSGDWVENPAVTPEPATLFLVGSGLAGLAGARLRRRRKV